MSEESQDHLEQQRLIEEYKADEIIPGDSVLVAAGIIIEMEEGRVPDLTPAKRLTLMKERIEELFTNGEENSETKGPGIYRSS